MKELKRPPVLRQWYRCPFCKTKLLIYDNTAHSGGVFIKCKTCKREIPVIIKAH